MSKICLLKTCNNEAYEPLCYSHKKEYEKRLKAEYQKIKDEKGILYFQNNQKKVVIGTTKKLFKEFVGIDFPGKI